MAFVAHPGSTAQDLPMLGGLASEATGVNDAGTVSGTWVSADGSPHAFRADPGSAPLDLGTLGGTTSAGFGITANGTVVGYSTTASGEMHAFRYSDATGTMEDLGTLGGASSFAWSANAAGVVVGESLAADNKTRGFVYANGTMADIGTLGGTLSKAFAVNASGLVAGQAMNSAGRWHAFRRPAGSSTLVDLGTLGGNWSGAQGVNKDGAIVGWSQVTGGTLHAFLWTDADGLVDLNMFVDPASGWVLSTAYAINDKGQITGYGFLDGQMRGFRLSPAVATDSTPPVIAGVSATPNVLDPPNHHLVPVTVAVSATDDSGEAPACAISDVSSSEPDNGLGDGDTAGDIVRVGPLSLQLRAERSASGNGRVYTIAVLCTDDAGNATPGAVTVTVGKGNSGTDPKKPNTR
jgi:probable HAF family extracellular repeat protein